MRGGGVVRDSGGSDEATNSSASHQQAGVVFSPMSSAARWNE